MSLLVTAAVSPLMTKVVKPVRRLVSYKRRTIRILACVHTPRQALSFVSLLDISHPTKRSPIFVYALHLVELTGRADAMLVVNSAAPTAAAKDYNHHQHLPALGCIQAQSDAITHIFESYEQHAGGVTIQCLTASSPYASMHEDIIAMAEDRHAALVILPFHKHQTVDGGMEVVHQVIRSLNQAVLEKAPGSVGILVDRGLGASGQHTSRYQVALLFFGGADDREALAFAGGIAGHPRINLKVVRFVYREGENQHQHHQVAVATGGSPRAERVQAYGDDGGGEGAATGRGLFEGVPGEVGRGIGGVRGGGGDQLGGDGGGNPGGGGKGPRRSLSGGTWAEYGVAVDRGTERLERVPGARSYRGPVGVDGLRGEGISAGGASRQRPAERLAHVAGQPREANKADRRTKGCDG